MKIIKITKKSEGSNFSIYVLGRCLIQVFDHYLMRVDIKPKTNTRNTNRLERVQITDDNIEICCQGSFSVPRMIKTWKKQTDKTEGFLYYKQDVPVGYLWVMYKGGDEYQYRIRQAESLGYHICIFEPYRGNRFVDDMLEDIFEYLYKKRIDEMYVSVRTNNTAAIKAYKRAGMKIIERKKFIRFLGFMIPYHII